MPLKRNQKGVALLLVMMVLAVISALAVEISGRTQLAMKRTIHLSDYDQSYWFLLSAEQLAKKVLKQDLDDNNGKPHLQQYWASENMMFPVEDGITIGGSITDMRSCFNVNALGQAKTAKEESEGLPALPVRQFQAMLEALENPNLQVEQIAQSIADYIDGDQEAQAYGAEDSDYEGRPVPYRAANTLLVHKSELRAVVGITESVYYAIKDYVCAIPNNVVQVVNVNTIDAEQAAILTGMFLGQLSLSEATSLIGSRPGKGWDSINDFWQESQVSGLSEQQELKGTVADNSDYFYLEAGVKIEDRVFLLDSIMKKDNNNNMLVLARQLGGQ